MPSITQVKEKLNIHNRYKDSPVGLLLEYHNLRRPPDPYERAQLLIVTCMDNRICLRIPEKFAFVIRTGGQIRDTSNFKFPMQ